MEVAETESMNGVGIRGGGEKANQGVNVRSHDSRFVVDIRVQLFGVCMLCSLEIILYSLGSLEEVKSGLVVLDETLMLLARPIGF